MTTGKKQQSRDNTASLQSELKYKHLVESLDREYIIYSHDTNGAFTYLSPSIVNVLGFTPDEFTGNYGQFMTDSAINRPVAEYTKAALRGEKQPQYEAEYWHRNGRRVHLRVTESPLIDGSGKVIGVEGIVQDITERKQLEQKRDDLIAQLEQALSEITTLRGILSTCQHCKKIRPPEQAQDDPTPWVPIEVYIRDRSELEFSHGICPECFQRMYGRKVNKLKSPFAGKARIP